MSVVNRSKAGIRAGVGVVKRAMKRLWVRPTPAVFVQLKGTRLFVNHGDDHTVVAVSNKMVSLKKITEEHGVRIVVDGIESHWTCTAADAVILHRELAAAVQLIGNDADSAKAGWSWMQWAGFSIVTYAAIRVALFFLVGSPVTPIAQAAEAVNPNPAELVNQVEEVDLRKLMSQVPGMADGIAPSTDNCEDTVLPPVDGLIPQPTSQNPVVSNSASQTK